MKTKVLITGVSLDKKSFGGVVNFNRLLFKNYNSNKRNLSFFSYGISPNWSRVTEQNSIFKRIKYNIGYFINIIRFIILLKNDGEIKIVQLNPTLSFFGVLRETPYIIISKMMGKKLILFFHGWKISLVGYESKGPMFFILRYLKKADNIIVLDKRFKVQLMHVHIPEEKISLLSTMVEYNKFYSQRGKIQQPFTLLFCGTVIRSKGIYELIDSIKELKERNIDIKLIILGIGPELSKIQSLSKEMKLNDTVFFKGYIDDRYSIFKEADIFILPSYSEGFPTVVLEAMASGMPIIMTKVGGILQDLSDVQKDILLTTNPAHSHEIADSVIKLISNPELLVKIGNSNQLLVEGKYDVDIICTKLDRLYNSM